MRAVWTFWSKPFQHFLGSSWKSELYHLLAWGLSFETARKHYPDTALYTDDKGARMLIDGIGLEFRQVSTKLNDLAGFAPDLWAVGKIYTYREQTVPFIHLDNDVFLWNRLPVRMESALLFAQNPEYFNVGKSHYKPEAFQDGLNSDGRLWLPQEWKWFYADGKRVLRGEWCGIFGGNHVEFINHYAQQAVRFVEHPPNIQRLLKLSAETGANDTCGLFEEYMLSACIDYHKNNQLSPFKNIAIEYLFNSISEAYSVKHAVKAGFTHMIGSSKKNDEVCIRLEKRMMQDYPELYERSARYFHSWRIT